MSRPRFTVMNIAPARSTLAIVQKLFAFGVMGILAVEDPGSIVRPPVPALQSDVAAPSPAPERTMATTFLKSLWPARRTSCCFAGLGEPDHRLEAQELWAAGMGSMVAW